MVQVERVSPKVPTVLVYCNRVLYRCVPCASRLPPVSYPVSLTPAGGSKKYIIMS